MPLDSKEEAANEEPAPIKPLISPLNLIEKDYNFQTSLLTQRNSSKPDIFLTTLGGGNKTLYKSTSRKALKSQEHLPMAQDLNHIRLHSALIENYLKRSNSSYRNQNFHQRIPSQKQKKFPPPMMSLNQAFLPPMAS